MVGEGVRRGGGALSCCCAGGYSTGGFASLPRMRTGTMRHCGMEEFKLKGASTKEAEEFLITSPRYVNLCSSPREIHACHEKGSGDRNPCGELPCKELITDQARREKSVSTRTSSTWLSRRMAKMLPRGKSYDPKALRVEISDMACSKRFEKGESYRSEESWRPFSPTDSMRNRRLKRTGHMCEKMEETVDVLQDYDFTDLVDPPILELSMLQRLHSYGSEDETTSPTTVSGADLEEGLNCFDDEFSKSAHLPHSRTALASNISSNDDKRALHKRQQFRFDRFDTEVVSQRELFETSSDYNPSTRTGVCDQDTPEPKSIPRAVTNKVMKMDRRTQSFDDDMRQAHEPSQSHVKAACSRLRQRKQVLFSVKVKQCFCEIGQSTFCSECEASIASNHMSPDNASLIVTSPSLNRKTGSPRPAKTHSLTKRSLADIEIMPVIEEEVSEESMHIRTVAFSIPDVLPRSINH